MVNYGELRLKCEVCDERVTWNVNKACNACEKDNRSKIVRNFKNEELEGNEIGGNKRNEKKQQER